jgi:nitrate/nitrite-specific signal transduction histidine kinase
MERRAAIALGSLLREAVRNAFRHAYDPTSFHFRIRDDAKGIDPRIVAEGRAGHYGVAGMRERAKRIALALFRKKAARG